MCGFAAFFEPGRVFPEALLAGVELDLAHRGPDSAGVRIGAGLGLVFRRLAIMDPGVESDQPMSDAAGRCTLVFNGEIYNFRSLRRELEAGGVRFRTSGDTETLLQAYLRWGADALERLEGMYAFVLVDRAGGIALAARDPFGIKPLYACAHGGAFALASEARPLARLVEPRVDEAALAELLTFGWAAGSLSNLQGVERVPGGTALTIPLGGGTGRRRRFFDIAATLRADPEMEERDALERAEAALESSVRAHLMSDVGYSLQLSGGVDSSLVAAMASRAAGREIASYAVSLGEHPFDEGRYRESVVRRYRLDHHECGIDGHSFAEALPRAVRHMEGPVPHGGCVTLMLLCERLRGEYKVVLTGEGADEMFGGYERYAMWRKLAAQERLAGLVPAALLPRAWPFLGVRRYAGRDAAIYSAVYHDFERMHRLFPGLVPGPGLREAVSARFSDFRDRLFAVDQSAYLESLLVRQDKMAMAASVEARVPFVDVTLARAVNRIPHRLRAPGKVTKPLLKRIAERFLDRELIDRRKVGLLLPYEDWLGDDAGLGRYLDLLAESSARLTAYAAPGAIAKVVARFRAGERRNLPSLWTLVNTELWLRSLAIAP